MRSALGPTHRRLGRGQAQGGAEQPNTNRGKTRLFRDLHARAVPHAQRICMAETNVSALARLAENVFVDDQGSY